MSNGTVSAVVMERLIQIAFGRSSRPGGGALSASETLARIDSNHPWSSPSRCSGRSAAQIGNPADLCRTGALIFIPTTWFEASAPNSDNTYYFN